MEPMEVLSFLMDVVQVPERRNLALLTIGFRDGTTDSALLTEEQVQKVAMTTLTAVKNCQLESLESLRGRGGDERAREFLDHRRLLLPDHPSSLEILTTDSRPYIHGGALVLPACKASGKLFLAVFDPFSADAFVVAADDCFGQPH